VHSPVTASPMATYSEYLAKGELAYQFSLAANKPFFFPRVVCPYSGTMNFEWRVSRGLGEIYAVTRFYPRGEAAYAVVLVDVDEGFRMMTRIVDADADEVAIGQRVRVSIRAAENGAKAPYFTLEKQ